MHVLMGKRHLGMTNLTVAEYRASLLTNNDATTCPMAVSVQPLPDLRNMQKYSDDYRFVVEKQQDHVGQRTHRQYTVSYTHLTLPTKRIV